ncbi:MAG TPA: PilZ domain-containing protein [Stellaceae bacterium]|nr:PilZ domain-containing protein [Stellaceae bacterium]
MRTSRTNFDRQESRRDRRYALPSLLVVIGEQEYISDNWSLGGFVLSAKLPLHVGAVVTGILHIDRHGGVGFEAQVVRKEEAILGFRFQNMTPLAVTKLDRALARRILSRRRS